MNLYTIDLEYYHYLVKYDSSISNLEGKKEFRPFAGVVLNVEYKNYIAPLSSPKKKHKKIIGDDCIKIEEGKYGVINLNNMIPIPRNCIRRISRFDEKDKDIKEDIDVYKVQYIDLLKKQMAWIESEKDIIEERARWLYEGKVLSKLDKSLDARCCDFSLLEEKCYEYMKINQLKEDEILYKF